MIAGMTAAGVGTILALTAPSAQAASATDELGGSVAVGVVSTSNGLADYAGTCRSAFYEVPVGVGSPNPQFELAGVISETGTDVLAVRVGCKVFQDGTLLAQTWSNWADVATTAGPQPFQEKTTDALTVCTYPYLIINGVVKAQPFQCNTV